MTINKRLWNLFRLKVSKTRQVLPVLNCIVNVRLWEVYISSARRLRVTNDTPKCWQHY